MTQSNNFHKDVRTNHVVEPDVPADGVVGVLLPAGAHVPQPGLVVEDAEAVDEHDGVEDEPPAALAELGEGGRQVGSPLLPEPSLHLVDVGISYLLEIGGSDLSIPEFQRDQIAWKVIRRLLLTTLIWIENMILKLCFLWAVVWLCLTDRVNNRWASVALFLWKIWSLWSRVPRAAGTTDHWILRSVRVWWRWCCSAPSPPWRCPSWCWAAARCPGSRTRWTAPPARSPRRTFSSETCKSWIVERKSCWLLAPPRHHTPYLLIASATHCRPWLTALHTHTPPNGVPHKVTIVIDQLTLFGTFCLKEISLNKPWTFIWYTWQMGYALTPRHN